MPRSSLNETPFDVSFGISRVCPRCGEDKLCIPQHWTGRWVSITEEDLLGNVTTKKVRRPTVYCRECVKLIKRENRLVHKIIGNAPPDKREEWAAMLKGACEICTATAQQRSIMPRFDRTWTMCSQCKANLIAAERSDDALAYAKAMMLDLTRHVADERRIEKEMLVRTDRPYVPHLFNPAMKGVTYPHLACVSLELSWRKLYQWLKSNDPPEPFAA